MISSLPTASRAVVARRPATYDSERAAFLRHEGYSVLRFSNHEVLTNLDGVLTLLMLELQATERPATPTLDPSPQGGGRRRSRKVVELGHRTMPDLPPPVGELSTESGRDNAGGTP